MMSKEQLLRAIIASCSNVYRKDFIMDRKQSTTRLITVAFLMALEIILTRFLSLALPFIRIGFGFLPIAIIGILYGPIIGGTAYALGDLLGGFLFPSGPYFPGFTLSAFLTGATFGLVLYKKQITWKRLFIASTIVSLGINLVLGSTWLYIILGNGLLGLLPARIVKSCIMVVVQPIIIHFVWHRILSKMHLF